MGTQDAVIRKIRSTAWQKLFDQLLSNDQGFMMSRKPKR